MRAGRVREQAGRRLVLAERRGTEGRVAVGVLDARSRRAVLQEQLDQRCSVVGGSTVQRCAAAVVHGVNVGAREREQPRGHLEVAASRSPVQRRVAR